MVLLQAINNLDNNQHRATISRCVTDDGVFVDRRRRRSSIVIVDRRLRVGSWWIVVVAADT